MSRRIVIYLAFHLVCGMRTLSAVTLPGDFRGISHFHIDFLKAVGFKENRSYVFFGIV